MHRPLALPCLLLSTLAAALPATAEAAGWSVAQSRIGTPVARLETGDAVVPVIELACDGARVGVGVQGRAGANVRSVALVVAGGSDQPISLALGRLGQVTSFSGYLPDNRLLDGIAGRWSSWRLSVGGRALAPSLAGGPAVIRQALARCYRAAGTGGPGGASPPVAQAGAGGSGLRPGVYIDVADYFAALGDPQPQSCARFRQTITYDGKSFVHRFYGGEYRGQVWTRTITRVVGRSGSKQRLAEKLDISSEKYIRPEANEEILFDVWQVGNEQYWQSAGQGVIAEPIRLRLCPEITPAAAAAWPLEIRPVDRGAEPVGPGTTDEEAVRRDVARIYGYRDGRKIREDGFVGGQFSPRIQALIDACQDAYDGAGNARDGSGAYDIVGDQGCGGDVFGLDERGDGAIDASKSRVALQRLPDGAIDARLTPGGTTLRYRKFGDRWLIDEATELYQGKRILYSDLLRRDTAEILKLPRLRRKAR